jgi:hypothetical protein
VRAAVLAGLVVVAVTACGGGGANNERLTKDELVQRANGVCAEYERKVKALGNPQTLTDLVTYARSAHQALADGLEQLRELHPPAELEAKYDTWVAAGDRALERIDELQKAAAKGDQIEIQRLVNAARREDEQSDRLASQLGMTECAND